MRHNWDHVAAKAINSCNNAAKKEDSSRPDGEGSYFTADYTDITTSCSKGCWMRPEAPNKNKISPVSVGTVIGQALADQKSIIKIIKSICNI